MTKRSILIGLGLAAALAGVTHINNNVVRQNGLIEDFLPLGVYGVLVLSLLTINPFLSLIRKPSWRLTGKEYAVILAISLVSCAVPNSGLMRFFPNIMMRPHQWVKTFPDWQREAALQKVPGFMIAGRPPHLSPGDIKAPAALATALMEGSRNNSFTAPQARIWQLIPDDKRIINHSLPSKAATTAVAEDICNALNAVLTDPKLYDAVAFQGYALTPEAKQILFHLGEDDPQKCLGDDSLQTILSAPGVSQEHLMAFNRHLVDYAWPEDIVSRDARLNEDLGSFLMGKGDLNEPLSLSEVPWGAWVRPLLFWIPVFLVMSVGVICLSVVIHDQWSHHERLPYPLIAFTNAMLPDNEGNNSGLFSKPGFWWAGGITFAIFVLNYINYQFPETVPGIPLELDFNALQEVIEFKRPGLARWALFTIRIAPVTIGIAYLVRSDVSLSVGISVPLSFAVMGTIAAFGINMDTKTSGGGLYSGGPIKLLIAGAAIAFALQVFYYGREYYLNVLKRAFFIKAKVEAPAVVVLFGRIFIVCAFILTVYLTVLGVDWYLAVIYIALAFTLFLVMSRVVAETGIFFYMADWYPCVTILAMLGINAIGPGIAIIMFMFSTVLLVRPKESLMPFAVGALKVLDSQRVKPFKLAPWFVGAIILAVLIALPITLRYIHGTGTAGDNGWTIAVSRYSFQKAVHMSKKLKGTGRFDEVESANGFERITRIELDMKCITFFLIGAGLVIGLSVLRLRWRKWPLHPVLILVMFVQPTVGIWHSFLIGWFIRLVVVRFGGHRAYSTIKPIMIGLIAGNILGLLLPNIVGAIYFYVSGGDSLSSPPGF